MKKTNPFPKVTYFSVSRLCFSVNSGPETARLFKANLQ